MINAITVSAAVVAVGIGYAGYVQAEAQPRYEFLAQGATVARLDTRTGEVVVRRTGDKRVVFLEAGDPWEVVKTEPTP